MEIIKFNAFDIEGKLVYANYRKFERGEKGEQIERSFPFDKFIELEPKLGEILAGSCYSVYLEESPSMSVYEKKFLDDTPNAELTEEEITYFKDLTKRACIDEEWDDLLKPPSVDEQVEDFIKEFFEDGEDEGVEQKDYLEEFFKELEVEDSDN
tara:strand:- start:953 stop:1414 length:462 start_codon:yes stop_codon:yes gene_type:complete